jgi:tail lysozyme
MAVKSIVDIAVNDEAFQRFQATFEKYQSQLAKMPASWAKMGQQAKEQRTTFEAVVAAMMAQSELSDKVSTSESKSERAARSMSQSWLGMARSTGTVAKNILSATTSLLKWTALTGVFSGLLGAGGLFGIDRLAAGAAAGRRSAMGLGVSYGEQKSFEVNYARLVDPQTFLSNVNGVLTDLSKRNALYGAGLTESQIKGKDTAEVAALLIPHLKQIADRTPTAQLQQVLSAYGLDQFVSVQDMERFKAMSPAEFAQMQRGYTSGRGRFAQDDATLKKWQDFSTKLQTAGSTIESVFIRGLVRLEPGLEKLTDSFTKTVTAFLGSDTVKHWLDALGPALEGFGKYIGSKQFQDDVATFAANVGLLSQAIVKGLQWLNIIPANRSDHDAKLHALDAPNVNWISANLNTLFSNRRASGNHSDYIYAAYRILGWSPERAAALTGNDLWESHGGNPNAWGDWDKKQKKYTAYGLAQWHKAGWQEFQKWAGHSIFGSSLEEQIAFEDYQLRNGSERAAGRRLQNAKTVRDATWAVDKYFERPASPSGSINQRTALAVKAGTPAHVTITVNNPAGANITTQMGQIAQ